MNDKNENKKSKVKNDVFAAKIKRKLFDNTMLIFSFKHEINYYYL